MFDKNKVCHECEQESYRRLLQILLRTNGNDPSKLLVLPPKDGRGVVMGHFELEEFYRYVAAVDMRDYNCDNCKWVKCRKCGKIPDEIGQR